MFTSHLFINAVFLEI